MKKWISILSLVLTLGAISSCLSPLSVSAAQSRAVADYTLFFQAPVGVVPQAYVWYGPASAPILPNGSWNATSNMTYIGNRWYSSNLLSAGVPIGQTVGVIFKDSSGNKLSGSNDLSRSSTGWCRVVGGLPVWSGTNPDLLSGGSIVLHYKSSWSSAAPTIWLWEGAGTSPDTSGNRPISSMTGASYPGSDLVKDTVADWWTYTISPSFYPLNWGLKMKFSNGPQVDLPGVVDGPRWYDGSSWSSTPPVTSSETLGAVYSPTSTKFRIWSPDSSAVRVTVGGSSYPCVAVPDFNGYTQVYQAEVAGNWKNQEYQFYISENPVRDPYALMAVPGTTKGIVVDMANILPSDGVWASRPTLANREDSIIYEVHVRDFTIDENSGIDASKKGKFSGMTQTGTTYLGKKTGIDHLKELGVTHVQLLPVYDFATPVYNWGYDPANFNVPEEQYSQETTPEGRIREFKDMINAFHKNGIRVIMDVVYNHTWNETIFKNITGKYYTNLDLAGVKSLSTLDDSNAMVSRFIRDSLENWVKNYNVDGFRFDLIGIFRTEIVKGWGEYLNVQFPDRNLLIYGEPWNGYASDPNEDQKVRLGRIPTLASAHIGAFNSKFRESLKGGSDDKLRNYIFHQNEMPSARWWGDIAVGMRGSIVAVKSTQALPNAWDPMFAYDPEQSINYLDAHDNLDLWDKIVYSGQTDGESGYAGRILRFGIGILLTSQGIPFLHAGDEFLRSKAYLGDFKTAQNTFNANDNYNKIRWSDLVDHAATNQYFADAIALRKATSSLRLTSWDSIKNQMKTSLNAGANSASSIGAVNDPNLPADVVVSYLSSNSANPTAYDTIVVFNPGNNFTLSLPAGSWKKVFDIQGAVNKIDAVCEGTAVTVFKKY